MVNDYLLPGLDSPKLVPYDVLKVVYDDLVLYLEDLRGLARVMHVCKILYTNYKDQLPLTMSYHVATYLLNTTNVEEKREYMFYYNEIIEKLLYEINLQNYLKS